MLQLNENDVAIHFCTFEAYLQKAKVNLRFPSLFFVEWKTINGKNAVGMVGRKRAINSLIELNETLFFTTEMLYHRSQRQYLKKQSLFHLNLISNSRPDQVKLVGRVVIDLSQVANKNKYQTIGTSKLMYCSVDAQISFSLKLTRSVESSIQLNQLDRSSFNDLYSFTTSFKKPVKNKVQVREVSESRARNTAHQRTQNILIEQISEQRSQAQSLPLTQKKPQLPLDRPNIQPTYALQIQKIAGNNEFEAFVNRQKDSLQRQLNDHKNKIKKLQSDMKQALRLFQQSQHNSQLNKSKLIESEQTIHLLRAAQQKLKQSYEKEINSVRQVNSREIQLLKAGYDADIKILQGKIQQHKIKIQDMNISNQNVISQYQQISRENEDLKYKLKGQESHLDQLAELKNINANLQAQKQTIFDQINKKSAQVNNLQKQYINMSQQKQSNLKSLSQEIVELKQAQRRKESEVSLLKSQYNDKIDGLQKQIKCLSLKNQESQSKINQIIAEYEVKLRKLTQELALIQQQKSKLQTKNRQSPQQNILNKEAIQNYQRLKEEHSKLTYELQRIRKSLILPEDYRNISQQNAHNDLFVIMQKSQLQQIEISELKEEKQAMKHKISQLQSVGKEVQPFSLQLQAQELNLLKQQLIKAKQSQEKHIQLQQSLRKQLQESNKQLKHLNQENQRLKKTHQYSNFSFSKEDKCIQVKQLKNDPQEKGPFQVHQESPNRLINGNELLDEPHNDHEQYHQFNFEEHNTPLTHEQVNKISQIKNGDSQEVQYLMQQIFKLKEQIEELRHQKQEMNKEQQPISSIDKNHMMTTYLELQKLKEENEQLKKQVAKYVSCANIKNQKQCNKQAEELGSPLTEQEKDKQTISDLQNNLLYLQRNNQQLRNQISNSPETSQLLEKYNYLLRELEAKLANLQEQMKIKDELIAEGERNLQENYTIKYQLADLKDKYSEIKSALEERNQMINYLEETKQQLSKQLQLAAEKSQHLAFNIESRQSNKQQSNKAQLAHQELYNEIQVLKKELEKLNTSNIILKNQLQEQINQYSNIQRINQQFFIKIQQNQNAKKDLQAQISDLSLIINGLNVQIERKKSQLQSLSEEMNTLSLRNNETALDIKKLDDQSSLSKPEIQIKDYQTQYNKLTQDLKILRMKLNDIIEESKSKEQKIHSLVLQLQYAKNKLQQFQVQNRDPLKTQLFQVQIHEIDSINEALPIQYSKSTIPLYERDELQKREREQVLNKMHQEIEALKKSNKQLQKQLAQQSQQKHKCFNDLQLANSKVKELQRQAQTMKDQIQKLTSLPIQSFNYMATPIKARHYVQTHSRHIKEPSIMIQPMVRAQIAQENETPKKNAFQKDTPHKQSLSKDIETRVETHIEQAQQKENKAEQLKKQIQILKQQLQSQGNLHKQLQQIHKESQNQYLMINKQYQNCMEELEHLKQDNQVLNSIKENITKQLYQIKTLLEKSKQQNDQLLRQYNEVINNKPQKSKQTSFKTKNNKSQSKVQQQGKHSQKQTLSLQQQKQYEERLGVALKNQQRLNNKIMLLQENIHNLQKAFQEHIESAQSNNDQISQKIQQLNELQSMAAQFQQEAQQFKLKAEQFAKLKSDNQQLSQQRQLLQKQLQEHKHCIEQRAQWQEKLQQIELILARNQNQFSQEREQLQKQVILLNQENANLVAQKSAIYETIKKESSLVVDNTVEQLRIKEAQLFLQVKALVEEKERQAKRVRELQTRLNKEIQQAVKKEGQLKLALTAKEQQVQQVRFINIQINQQIQQIKIQDSEKDRVNITIKEQNIKLLKEISILKAKIQDQAILVQKLSQNIQGQIKGIQRQQGQYEGSRQQVTTLRNQVSQLQQQLKTSQAQFYAIRQEILNRIQQEKEKEEKLVIAEQKIKNMQLENNQFMSNKQRLQTQLQKTNARYLQLQNAVKNTSKLSDTKDRLAQTLRSQIGKRQLQIKDLNARIDSKQQEIMRLNTEMVQERQSNKRYELKMKQLMEKQALMKQTMEIIENQSKRIVQTLQNRYQSQQNYYRICIQRQKENNRLSLSILQAQQQASSKERIINYEQQKANQLKNQLQIIRNNMELQSAMSSRIATVEYQKYHNLMQKNEQLINKNKEYLQIINSKSQSSLQNQKLKQEMKLILQKMNEYEQKHMQTKQQLDSRIPQLQNQLELLNHQNLLLHQRINELNKQLQNAKQINIRQRHKFESLITEKDRQINDLKALAKKDRQAQPASSVMQDQVDNSNISFLNEQIMNLNKELLQKQSQLNRLKTQVHIVPLPIVPQTPENNIIDHQKQDLKAELIERERRQQQYKQMISRLQELLKEKEAITNQITSQQVNQKRLTQNEAVKTLVPHDMHNLCQQIKDLCAKRNSKEQSDKLFQAFLQKYDLMQEQFNNLNGQTSIIQQKAKFISKELQRIKSFIIKNQNRSFKQKTQLLAMIKPCETAASELVNISQTLSEKESQNFI